MEGRPLTSWKERKPRIADSRPLWHLKTTSSRPLQLRFHRTRTPTKRDTRMAFATASTQAPPLAQARLQRQLTLREAASQGRLDGGGGLLAGRGPPVPVPLPGRRPDRAPALRDRPRDRPPRGSRARRAPRPAAPLQRKPARSPRGARGVGRSRRCARRRVRHPRGSRRASTRRASVAARGRGGAAPDVEGRRGRPQRQRQHPPHAPGRDRIGAGVHRARVRRANRFDYPQTAVYFERGGCDSRSGSRTNSTSGPDRYREARTRSVSS